ncbi:hypothetical protein CF15_04555 [Pyrodictium occultum]|uniref:Thioredoxin/glutaredoxin n=1 Tax=Pyrodictium occultum TaxID=2309 RepID=A0A0V8RVH6_PYROC|nr:hypothetical protein [Pyrodictium occultum]KSW12055.1 hypothetical protein CF15_04555 [Pyrodictium occultum]
MPGEYNKYTLYIHPTCASSYEVVKHLAGKGLLDSVRLVSTAEPAASQVLGRSVWSVPWLVVDEVPVATDPVEPAEVEAILLGEGPLEAGDPVEEFMEAVLHSAYAAAVAYLHGSVKPVADTALISAATRAPLRGLDVEEVAREVLERADELYAGWEDKIMRALGISFVRELWWAHGGELEKEQVRELATPGNVGLWLVAKASIGRSGLPSRPMPPRERLERLAGFVRRGAAGLLFKVRREQETILGDEEYWKLLGERLAG